MKRIVIYSIMVLLSLISCNGQDKKSDVKQIKKNKKMSSLKYAPYNISDDGDGTKSNYDNFPVEFINRGKSLLEQRKFKFPNNESFNQKILEVYGFNLNEYENSIFVLQPSMFPEIALRKENFIFLQDANANEPEFLNADLLYHYNSYIFYNTPVSYIWLQANSPEVLRDLVVHYGYSKDKKLIEMIFVKFDFNSLVSMEELIFKDSNHKKELKKQIFDAIEKVIYKGQVEDLSYAKEGNGYVKIGDIINKIDLSPTDYVEPEETKTFLFERELRVGIVGDIESYLNKDSSYRSTLEKNNFYNFPILRDYVKYIYQRSDDATTYVIDDSDGYTNLRKEKNAVSEILQKIKSGEFIEVLDNEGDWY